MRRTTPGLVLTSLLAALPARLSHAGGCSGPISVQNTHSGWAECGGFETAGTPLEGKSASKAPEIRFWAHGHFAQANSGAETQGLKGFEWLLNHHDQMQLAEAPPTVLSLWQANWMGSKLDGCVMQFPDKRTAVELTFVDPDREGKLEHRGFYAVSSVEITAAGTFDFDDVRGAGGKLGNVVPILPIPAPKVLSVGATSGGFMVVNLELEPVASYSEKGKDAPVKLISGYRILYATEAAPTSSDPAGYKPARASASSPKDAQTLKPGQATVAVPAGKSVWLVSQLVFDDPSPLFSRATSAHVALSGAAPTAEAPPTGSRTRPGGRTR